MNTNEIKFKKAKVRVFLAGMDHKVKRMTATVKDAPHYKKIIDGKAKWIPDFTGCMLEVDDQKYICGPTPEPFFVQSVSDKEVK